MNYDRSKGKDFVMLTVDTVIFCPRHMDEDARMTEWKKAKEEVDLYKEQLKSIKDKIESSISLPDRDSLFRELLDIDLKLKVAELEFFGIMETLCS